MAKIKEHQNRDLLTFIYLHTRDRQASPKYLRVAEKIFMVSGFENAIVSRTYTCTRELLLDSKYFKLQWSVNAELDENVSRNGKLNEIALIVCVAGNGTA